MATSSVPQGFHTLTPSLIVRDGSAAIAFYERALGATVRDRMDSPEGKLMHAEMQVGDSRLMLGEEWPDFGFLSPQSLGGSPVTFQVYVADADAVFARAVAAGGEVVQPMEDQFWGDRSGRVKDPSGHQWTIATRIEEVSPEEMEKRAAAWMQSQEK